MARTTAGTTPTGRTPTYKFPYPTKDDVHDIAFDIKTLAEAINTRLNLLIPRGAIAAFPFTAVPAGWHICDGGGGTPNLRDKFIRAAGSGHAHHAVAGSHTVKLTAANMPRHTHRVTFGGPSGGHAHGNGTITPKGGTSANGNHTHGAANGQPWAQKQGGWSTSDFDGKGGVTTALQIETKSGWAGLADAGMNHAHGFTIPAFRSGGPSAGHTHTGTVATVGSGTAFTITPLYYAVVFAMKL